MFMLIYEKKTGRVLAKVCGSQNLQTYCSEFTKDELEKIDSIYLESAPENHKDYKLINGELCTMTEQELREVRMYNRFLTEEERLLNQLKPTQEEITKAENTIKILTLLQEVM